MKHPCWLLLWLASLAGCSSSPGGPERGLDPMTTASIPKPAVQKTVIDAVAPSDWERIRLVASTSMTTAPTNDVLDWTNPDTGSNGTLTPVAAARADPDGKNCRAFGLTVSDVRGIRRYRGDACRAPDGMWQLSSMVPEDSALL
jgi:surface antigen